jgi:CspA family cold shock protein
MARGTVSKFNAKDGYGFIRPDKTQEEIFVHGSSVTSGNTPPLSLGQTVYFEILNGPHGRQAVEVRPARTHQPSVLPID